MSELRDFVSHVIVRVDCHWSNSNGKTRVVYGCIDLYLYYCSMEHQTGSADGAPVRVVSRSDGAGSAPTRRGFHRWPSHLYVVDVNYEPTGKYLRCSSEHLMHPLTY